MDYEWKEGQEVVLIARYLKPCICTIEKVTPKGFAKIGDSYFKPDGRIRSSDVWNTACIEPATPELKESIRNEAYIAATIKRLKSVKKLTLEQAKELNSVLNGL